MVRLHTSRTCDTNTTKRRVIGYLLTRNGLAVLELQKVQMVSLQAQYNQWVRPWQATRDWKQSEMHTAIPQMWTRVDLLGNTMRGAAVLGRLPVGRRESSAPSLARRVSEIFCIQWAFFRC
jgi:hypothetical protein